MSLDGRRAGPGSRRPRFTTRHDRGAVALIVALLLGSGVLIGMAALVVDVGNLYAERRQLQGGADAAALKVAQVCASPTGCESSASTAGEYARANANDKSAAAIVCGRAGGLPEECDDPAPSGGTADCVGPAPEAPTKYAEVHTSTLDSAGNNLLPAVFAQAVLGGFEGAEVSACARAAWGPPARANGLALTISICDWKGASFRDPPVEQVIAVYDEADPTSCVAAGGSATSRGGFRWLRSQDPKDRTCRAVAAVQGRYGVETGDSQRPGCPEALTGVLGQPALVPVFDAISGGGGNAQYRVEGIAAFVITGWNMPGPDEPSRMTGRSSCEGGVDSCIYGYFTRAVLPGSGAIGGPDRGAQIIALIG